MKQGSLQAIQDSYERAGLRGRALREALSADSEYQELLRARQRELTKRFGVPEKDVGKYVLSVDVDYEILGRLYELEQLPLSEEDRNLITFLKTQLEHDWREPLRAFLDKLLRRYKP